MSTQAIAALPMYDFPALRSAHADLWRALRSHLIEAGVAETPAGLTMDLHHEAVWTHPGLLLGQACEYPLAKSFASHVRVVASPRYTAPGCEAATYRSAIVVRLDDRAQSLSDLRGYRCLVNDPLSNSGMNLLRAAIAPVARESRFFRSVEITGSHRSSAKGVSAGKGDVAAIDCVTFAHLQTCDPEFTRKLRVLAWTPATPSLPIVTSSATDDVKLGRLRIALAALADDPVAATARRRLLLRGFDLSPASGFAAVLELEEGARRAGYGSLA